jgi:hypothetical protein
VASSSAVLAFDTYLAVASEVDKLAFAVEVVATAVVDIAVATYLRVVAVMLAIVDWIAVVETTAVVDKRVVVGTPFLAVEDKTVTAVASTVDLAWIDRAAAD